MYWSKIQWHRHSPVGVLPVASYGILGSRDVPLAKTAGGGAARFRDGGFVEWGRGLGARGGLLPLETAWPRLAACSMNLLLARLLTFLHKNLFCPLCGRFLERCGARWARSHCYYMAWMSKP